MLGLKTVWAFSFTSFNVSGLVRSQPNKPIAAPAQIAEPKAVDLRSIFVNAFHEIIERQRRTLSFRVLSPQTLLYQPICSW